MSKHKKVETIHAWGCYGNAMYVCGGHQTGCNPYWVLPRDAASYDAMDNQIWEAVYFHPQFADVGARRCSIIAATGLAAIGITRPKETKA